MFWNRWLSRFAACELSNTRVTKRRTGTRGVDPSIPVAAQVLELEARVLPADIVVTTTADTINPDDGVISLREAIIQANTNAVDDIIQLAAGTYTLTLAGIGENAAATGDLDILNNGSVIIVGAGANQTVISAAGLGDRVLHVANGSTLGIQDVTISGGVADQGGGIYNQGRLDIVGSTISGNQALINGGGISNEGRLRVIATTISGNSAESSAGGIENFGVFVRVQSSTISGNAAQGFGGGLTNASVLSVENSTITGNRSDTNDNDNGTGGGLHNFSGATSILLNTIVAGNFVGTGSTADDVTGSLEGTSVFNLIGNSDTAGGLTNGNNDNIVGVDPATVLDPILADNGGPTLTHALIPGSPAVNAGDPTETLFFDQRGAGFARVLLGRVDIGAVEAPNTAPTLNSTPSTTTFSKKAAKKNGAPQIMPNVVVTDPDNATGAKLGGGVLSFSVNLQGKQHKKKGLIPFDKLGGLSGVSAIGNLSEPSSSGGQTHFLIALHAETTVGQVQSFLRGLTFSTKGKGALVATRVFLVQVTDDAGDPSAVIEQTINVGK